MKLRSVLALLAGGIAWLGGCSASSKEGVTVTVEAAAPGARAFATSAGVHVVLTRALLNLGSVEIFACPTTRWLDFARLREAHAHVVGSPTLLGTPLVESLLAEDGARTKMGELHPPPGSYCRIKQTVLAADADAPGSPPDGAMLGKSLLLEGTYAPAGEEPRPFRLMSTASFDVETMVDAVALAVDGRRSATIVLSLTASAWFDGVDFAADPADAATRVLENVRAALGARLE